MLFFRNFVLVILLLLLFLSSVSIYYLKALIKLYPAALSRSVLTTLSVHHIMITQKLINLTNAMIEYEGWAPDKHPASKDGGPTVSYRNHNPGNLRASLFAMGIRDGFAFFYNDATGLFAMRYDIACKCIGKTKTSLGPDSTLKELIEVYSSAKGEQLDSYVKFVCSRTGLTPDMRIGELVK